MKHIKILYIVLVALFFCNSCKDKDPVSLGVQTVVGKIIGLTSPTLSPKYPPVPCLVTGLETATYKYYLSFNSHLICGNVLVVEGVEYLIDEGVEVEVTGEVTTWQNHSLGKCFCIEIESIKKLQ